MAERMAELAGYLAYRDVISPEISQADIAWQLDHTLKAIIGLTEGLENSDPEFYALNFNIARTLVFTAGDFPRGVAQAPESVRPPEVITDTALLSQLALARTKIELLQNLPERSSYDHAQFGLLNRNQVARLIEVHTDHHLKIIRDILVSEGKL